MRLKGKACVITGAASGIGRQSALLFASEGGRILVADRDAAGAERAAREIRSAGGEAYPFEVDVGHASEVEAMIAEAERRFSGVQVLFNNAGIFPAADGGPEETSEEVWDDVMRVNLKGVFLGCKFGIPALLRAGRFDRQVLVDRPDKVGRVAILNVHIKKVILGEGVETEQIAALTPGFTGADLANLVNEAALLATRRGARAVVMEDFTSAIERIIAGLEKKSRVMNPHERQVIAYHETGHAGCAGAAEHRSGA